MSNERFKAFSAVGLMLIRENNGKEEILLQKINAYVTGNWTFSDIICYDSENVEVAKGTIQADYENQVLEDVIFLEEAVKVKTMVIVVTSIKWGNPITHKIGEIEIFVANPNYIAPPAEDII